MDGIFRKQKSTLFGYISMIFGGLMLTVLFGLILAFGKFTTLDDIFGGVMCIGLGLLMTVLGGLCFCVNRKVYIRVDERSVSAYCPRGRALHCQSSDIEDVSYAGTELIIQLQNGKKYRLMNLQNAYEIGKYIFRRIPHKPVEKLSQSDEAKLRTQIQSLKKIRNFIGISSLVCFLLVFVEIIVAAVLTDWKEMNDFSSADWSLFAVMAVMGMITFAGFVLFLLKWVAYCEKYTQATETLFKIILYTYPLEPGNAIRLFVNDERYPIWRLAVYGYPGSKEVYYTIEVLGTNATLCHEYRSEIFPDYETLYETLELELFAEISLPSADV